MEPGPPKETPFFASFPYPAGPQPPPVPVTVNRSLRLQPRCPRGGSGSRKTTPRFAEAAVPPPMTRPPPPTLPAPPLPPPPTLPPPPLPLDLLPLRPPLEVAPPPAALSTAARANAPRASAGTKSGINSSTTTLTSSRVRFGSYSKRTRVPTGSPSRTPRSSVNTRSANLNAVFGSQAPWEWRRKVSILSNVRSKPKEYIVRVIGPNSALVMYVVNSKQSRGGGKQRVWIWESPGGRTVVPRRVPR